MILIQTNARLSHFKKRRMLVVSATAYTKAVKRSHHEDLDLGPGGSVWVAAWLDCWVCLKTGLGFFFCFALTVTDS